MDYVFNDDHNVNNDDEETEDTTESTNDNVQRIFGAEDEPEQTTRGNHSVEWLSENGDVMIPVVDHETTTMIRIGHLDSDKDNNMELDTKVVEAATEQVAVEEDDVSQRVQWTTEKPLEEENATEQINNNNSKEESPAVAEESVTTPTTTATEKEPATEIVLKEINNLPTTATTTESVVTSSVGNVIFFEESSETESPADQEITTTPISIEVSTTQIEISFAMSGNKEMSEELHEKLMDSITSIVHDMTTTTTESNPEVDAVLAEENNNVLLAEVSPKTDENTSEAIVETSTAEDAKAAETTTPRQVLVDDQVIENLTEIPIEDLAEDLSDSNEIIDEIKQETTTAKISSHEPKQLEFAEAIAPTTTTTAATTIAIEAITTTPASEPAVSITTTVSSEPIAVAVEIEPLEVVTTTTTVAPTTTPTQEIIENEPLAIETTSEKEIESSTTEGSVTFSESNDSGSDLVAIRIGTTTEASIEISGLDNNNNLNNETFEQALKEIVSNVTKELSDNESTTESAAVSVDITGELNGITSKDLEETLKDVVATVTKELQSTTTPLSVEIPAATTTTEAVTTTTPEPAPVTTTTEAAATTTTPEAAPVTTTTETGTTTSTTESNDLVNENTPIAADIEEGGELESQARPRKLSGAAEEDEATNGTSLNALVLSSGSDLKPCNGSDQFKCGDGACIDRYLRCDKIFDCLDSSDESDCGEFLSLLL